MKILANDGLAKKGIEFLEKKGFEVITTKVAQGQLENYINQHVIDAIIVRGNTEIREELIDACSSLKLIARAGVGMDNIDVEYAIDQGLHVINTPESSTISVAELVFAHLLGMARFLHQSNREMPLEGDLRFNELKRQFSAGTELRGKTLGIIGFGRIGQEVAKIAIGLGMKVIANDPQVSTVPIEMEFFNGQRVIISIDTTDMESLLKKSDFISIHVPYTENHIIGSKELEKMKTGVGIVNTARGGVLDEVALVDAINDKKVKFAALDVFENEPQPEVQLLMNPELSLSPHIGGSTLEAQERIGMEVAEQISRLFSSEFSKA